MYLDKPAAKSCRFVWARMTNLLLPPGIKGLNLPSSLTADTEGISISGVRNSEADITRMDFTEAKIFWCSKFLNKQQGPRKVIFEHTTKNKTLFE